MVGRKSKKNIKNTINNNVTWKVAIYCRLSSDEGDNAESDSIINQKELISQCLKKESDMKIVDYYIDDGYSGTSFMRPDFKRMITDIVNEKINTIVVKDLSRFGRNYNVIVPFKNLMNDEYARDISNKVKSVYRTKALKGEFVGGTTPYGYKKKS